MNLKSYRCNGRIVIGPQNKEDITLFSHCAEGSIAVITRIYNKEVEPMLLIHGVTKLTIADET